MRKQIAAANWKMNLNYEQALSLTHAVISGLPALTDHQQVILGVPFPYLLPVVALMQKADQLSVAAQNCSDKSSGAFTGETSAEMLASIGVSHVIVGHSERRECFHESNSMIAEKVNLLLQYNLIPIFCCGEPLAERETENQNVYVAAQLRDSLFHLNADQFTRIIIAYEPIWAIGTGKTATAEQAEAMHAFIRQIIADKFGAELAENCSILYGGSVKGNNAKEIFSMPNVDGGLVGGASLKADEFLQVIGGLK